MRCIRGSVCGRPERCHIGLVLADNIANGDVVEVPAQQDTELRLQLVASPENLLKTIYDPDDTCACAHLHACTVRRP